MTMVVSTLSNTVVVSDSSAAAVGIAAELAAEVVAAELAAKVVLAFPSALKVKYGTSRDNAKEDALGEAAAYDDGAA